ncbi:hypothetical protein [Candidatus Thiosymbion oneisti]|nr:hypothetical protein [Candidatus Thiosymbion oneisti]
MSQKPLSRRERGWGEGGGAGKPVPECMLDHGRNRQLTTDN